MKKSLNPYHKFVCIKCNYSTNSKKDYNKHCTTKKHKKSHSKEKITTSVEFVCPYCDKTYKFRSGLSRHKKKCNYRFNIIVEKIPENFELLQNKILNRKWIKKNNKKMTIF